MSSFIKDRRKHLESTTKFDSPDDLNLRLHEEHYNLMKLSTECVPLRLDYELPGKGVTRCNRTACQTDKHVVFTNTVMDAKYCVSCATDIRFCNNLDELDLYPDYNNELDALFMSQGLL